MWLNFLLLGKLRLGVGVLLGLIPALSLNFGCFEQLECERLFCSVSLGWVVVGVSIPVTFLWHSLGRRFRMSLV